MKFPQCVYNDDTVKGFENCEYKIIHSLEEFLKLPLNWGKSQRAELKSEGFDVSSNELDFESDDFEGEIDSDSELVVRRKRGRPPKVRD